MPKLCIKIVDIEFPVISFTETNNPMFFVLSKVFSFLQSPLSWILIAIMASFFAKKIKRKKIFAYVAGLIFIVFSNELLVDFFIGKWEVPIIRLKEIKPEIKVAVILCGITSPGSQPDDRINILSSPDRALHPVMLFKKGLINKIIVTGGSGSLFGAKKSEATELKELLIICGVPDSSIIIEDQSRNTFENAQFIRPILNKLGVTNNFLLVTSAFHMRRSLACFKKYSVEPQPFSVNASVNKGSPIHWDKLILPSSYAFPKWQMLNHEVLGYISYKLAGYI